MSCRPHIVSAPGQVIATVPGRVLLNVSRQSACSACSQKDDCGNQKTTPGKQKIWFSSQQTFAPGETVTVSLPETAIWHAALLMYGLPLAGFIVGLLGGAGLGGESFAPASALIGLASAHWLACRLARKQSVDPQIQHKETP